ncbi:bidirectional sugar transporter SWEET12-like [Quercus robur]|uniref:bidirectional sugar transporter SWEET12-like n=1 Tax=Quercus robur TaxID=38942 RepID=UPI002162764A|nr:bidirectional sugar transporter SWEET12-like [Quercus robur]
MVSTHSPLVFSFGILGNIISFVVFLAPVPTFIRVCKKKSTEGFQSVPYVVALFSAMVWLYYASLKSNEILLITANTIGCVVETIYIAIYIAFAPKQARIFTLRLLILMNFGGFCLILLLSHFLAQGETRVRVLGWVCVAFSVSVFAAPLSIMRVVIRTKSVEFMPFYLSLFLTLSAIVWHLYGVLQKDLYVALPNILGFIFGVLQMVLYMIYKNYKTVIDDEKLSESKADIVNLSMSETNVCSQPNSDEKGSDTQNEHEQKDQDVKTTEASNQGQLLSVKCEV